MTPPVELPPSLRVENGPPTPPTAPQRRRGAPLWFWFAAAALFIAIPLLAFRGIRENSVTIDEFAHMPAGYAYWRTGDFSIYARNPPLIKLIETIPWLISAPPWRDE